MRRENQRGLVVAFYLSKFDRQALAHLNYASFNAAFDDIGRRLGMNPNSVKNMRDEFDPLFGNRLGWYQRDLRPSRAAVVRAFNDLPEETLRNIVADLLAMRGSTPTEVTSVVEAIQSQETARSVNPEVLTRGVTGRKAEEYFNQLVADGKLPEPFLGRITDCRELGQGYDFELATSRNQTIYIEVKGSSGDLQGIALTDKEWRVAHHMGGRYYLVVVSNVDRTPTVSYLQNPAKVLSPKRNLSMTVSVTWSLSHQDVCPLLRGAYRVM